MNRSRITDMFHGFMLGIAAFMLLYTYGPRGTEHDRIKSVMERIDICQRLDGGTAEVETIWTNTDPPKPDHWIVHCYD